VVAFYIVTAAALAASLIAGRRKTPAATNLAVGRLAKILPAFLVIPALFAVAITLAPPEMIRRLLGQDRGALGVAITAAIGPITRMRASSRFPLVTISKPILPQRTQRSQRRKQFQKAFLCVLRVLCGEF
jgi:hypothetical protein